MKHCKDENHEGRNPVGDGEFYTNGSGYPMSTCKTCSKRKAKEAVYRTRDLRQAQGLTRVLSVAEKERRLYMAEAQARFKKRRRETEAWLESTHQHVEDGEPGPVDDGVLDFSEQGSGLRGLIDNSIWMRGTTKISSWKAI